MIDWKSFVPQAEQNCRSAMGESKEVFLKTERGKKLMEVDARKLLLLSIQKTQLSFPSSRETVEIFALRDGINVYLDAVNIQLEGLKTYGDIPKSVVGMIDSIFVLIDSQIVAFYNVWSSPTSEAF